MATPRKNPEDKQRPGPRGKYKPSVVLRLCTAIGLGSTYKMACQYAGINETTFYLWMNDPPGELIFPERLSPELSKLKSKVKGLSFPEIVDLYEGEAAVKWLAKIEQAATGGLWTAAAWKLERRYPEDYGRTVKDTRVSGPEGGPVRAEVTTKPDLSNLSPDELDAFQALWRKVTGAPRPDDSGD